VLAPGGRVLVVEFSGAHGLGWMNPVGFLHRHEHPDLVADAADTMAGAGLGGMTRGELGIGGLGFVRATVN
jgi:hypothetical protein